MIQVGYAAVVNNNNLTNDMTLSVKLMSPNAQIPTYGSGYAAGLDVYSAYDYTIPSHTRMMINTDIAMSWEGDDAMNYYLRVAPRSGLALKNIDVAAGVCDYDYRNSIKVILVNHGNEDYQVKRGDRVAQLILEKIKRFNHIVIVDELTETQRGQNGFGSTGR
jgi:dUTP pyrophosphatase